MYIGHLPEIGPIALAGVGVTMPVILAVSAFSYLFSSGGAARVFYYDGKEKRPGSGTDHGELRGGAAGGRGDPDGG